MKINIEHNIKVVCRDRIGRIVRVIRDANLTTTEGLELLAEHITAGADPVSHIAVGDGDTAADAGDTSLGGEFLRKELTDASTDGSGVATFTLFIAPTEGNGSTIKEAGLFTAEAGGEMLARVVFDAADQIAKDDTISVEVSWDVTFSNV